MKFSLRDAILENDARSRSVDSNGSDIYECFKFFVRAINISLHREIVLSGDRVSRYLSQLPQFSISSNRSVDKRTIVHWRR